jgi:hypothetical protein
LVTDVCEPAELYTDPAGGARRRVDVADDGVRIGTWLGR